MKLLIEELEKKVEGSSVLELSAKGVQAASKSLDSIYKKNAMKRAEYPNQPEQYMDSELALYEQLNALQALATDTTVYKYILNSNLMPTLIQLLGHENMDVCSSVVSLLIEWIDPSLVEEDPAVLPLLKTFADTTMEGWMLIAGNLVKFQKDDDSQDKNLKGVDNTLSLMENLLELDAVLAPEGILEKNVSVQNVMANESNIVSWLFFNAENTDNHSNQNDSLKARCFELLALFSQSTDLYKRKDTFVNGIEILLQSIAIYRKKQPEADEEIEILENSCMCLSSSITFSKVNLSSFLMGHGVELVIRCLKEKIHAGGSSLKLLDFFGDDKVYKEAAERLVVAGALKFLFPIFGGSRYPKPAAIQTISIKAKRKWLHELKVQTIRIFYALTFQLDSESPKEAMPRFISKFVEDDMKYTDRLIELLLEYDERARKAEYQFFRSDIEDTINDDQVALAAFDAKLSGGGDICHRLAAITAYICANSKRCHERVLLQLKMKQSGMSLIKDTLHEFATSLHSNGRQKEHIESLSRLI
ncbi:hypothetical protein FRACYDRAFT_207489 [Fragilariopsis cylindrus CCMP1102]|uniref:Beta-catenin-like protein 1 N-terminal domain-containing protein n=1 Tax=Fragilariopsis cylindrus CCMP1102 TaxID=635003 RepID=A0A1E7FGA5_9STRA|nr:hypothetical protein FRACYDRAFT_207489 [Fragilariopsis cylindrus CCMP1102]|eukprot:OEU17164.1 hypothetical protein FRACYDRAFT_207489 [Fragilariopsis cylindrus CCMP1102]